MRTELDSFETQLLAELRAVVSGRTAQPTPVPRRRRRLLLPAGVAVLAAAAVVWVPGVRPQPAYAVTVDGAGDVHVRVHRFEDAAGLEDALAAQGITADVRYLADDQECAPGRYVTAAPHPGQFSFSAGAGFGYRIDLAGGVVRPDETLVVAASRSTPRGDPDGDGISDQGGAWVSVGVASGPVAPCRPVPRR